MSTTVRSIYIPHVFSSITLAQVREVLETKFHVGTIHHMESIPKVNKTDGHLYYSCFVYFDSWSNSPCANYLTYQLENNQQTKMFYTDANKKYWIICQNKSELQHTVHLQPKHMSIVAQIPADVSISTVATALDAMDLGKIYAIHYCHDTVELTNKDSITFCKNMSNPNPYEETWSPTTSYNNNDNTIHTLSSLPVRTICIHFDYWYRTKTASAFQDMMAQQRFVIIPVYINSMQWTFYETEAITDGVNPHVWTK